MSSSRPAPVPVLSGLLCCAALAQAVPAVAPTMPWRGPGWYEVQQQGPRLWLRTGPYLSELACTRSMSAHLPDRVCSPLPVQPPPYPRPQLRPAAGSPS